MGDPAAKERDALAARQALAEFTATARKETAGLRSISGLSIPALGAASTMEDLRWELTNFIDATEKEIARCEREAADYLRRADTVVADSAHVSRLMGELAAEIEQTRAAATETETLVAAEIRAATAVRDEILQLQDSTNRIRQEIRNVRNQLFPRLHQAAHLGWIHPPSSYRPLPQPLPPTSEHVANTARESVTEIAPAVARPDSSLARTDAVSLDGPRAIPTGPSPSVQSLLDRLPALEEKARAAVGRRDEATRALERQLSEKDTQSARLSALQPERTLTANRLGTAKRNLAIARQTHEEYATRRAAGRSSAVNAWIEWGLYQQQETKAAALLARAQSELGQPAFLEAWRNVAATAVQLGSDPAAVIATYAAQVAARGENLDELRKALADTREKFRLPAGIASVDLPATVQPYLPKAAP